MQNSNWGDDYEEDKSYHETPKREEHYSEEHLGSGSKGCFPCPECGSWNTAQGVYFDECRSCGYSQGY